jgi:chromosomal replication initiation ATPase DnaA
VKLKPEEVLAKVAKMYKEKPEEILRAGRRESEARSVAIYLLKKRSQMSSREIGLKMGIGASAVGNQWLKIKKRLAENKELANKLVKC